MKNNRKIQFLLKPNPVEATILALPPAFTHRRIHSFCLSSLVIKINLID